MGIVFSQYPQDIYFIKCLGDDLLMDILEIRRHNLIHLIRIKSGGKAADFADLIKKDASYIRRCTYEQGKAGRKNIKDEILQAIYTAFPDLHPGWMDIPQWDVGITNPDSVKKLAAVQSGVSNVIPHHHEDPIPDGFVSIGKSKVSFSAGNGHTANYEFIEDGKPAIYRLDWFHSERLNPNKVRRFEVIGDSMEPWTFSGESVLVNLAENDINSIIDGDVYAIRYDNELKLKRLYRRLDGSLTLKSYNPDYKDEDVPANLVHEHISIIGRVRDRTGKGK